jgi:hypothetical protein
MGTMGSPTDTPGVVRAVPVCSGSCLAAPGKTPRGRCQGATYLWLLLVALLF